MSNDQKNSKNVPDTERINPLDLTIPQAAKILSAALGIVITERQIAGHIESGAPISAAGKVNLVHYGAWLNRHLNPEGKSDGN